MGTTDDRRRPAEAQAVSPPLPLPFSRPFVTDRLRPDADVEVDIEAAEHERDALGKLEDLVRIDRLAGRFRLSRHGALVRVVGRVDAEIVQTCVVTLEPFATTLSEPVDVRFAPQTEVAALEGAAARRSGEAFLDVADATNIPDPIIDGRIDLGGVAAEFLSLALDPYPRKPGAMFAPTNVGAPPRNADVSPFAALRSRERDRD